MKRVTVSSVVVAVASLGVLVLALQTPLFSQAKSYFSASGDTAEAGRNSNEKALTSVKVEPAVAGSLPVLRNTIGVVVASSSTAVSSSVPGLVASVEVKDGVEVKAGDLLVQLDDREIRATIEKDKAAIAKDQATLDNANASLKRINNLVKTGVDTTQAGDDALAAVQVAAAQLGVDQAQMAADEVSLADMRIVAPFDGRLGVLAVSRGAYLAPGTPVTTITQTKPVFAEFTLPESDLAMARTSLSVGRLAADIKPVGADEAGKVSGPIVFIDNGVDQASGTFKLRALLANEDEKFLPGQALDVQVKAGDQSGLVIVSGVAIQPRENGFACYVVKADGTVETRNVTLALRVGDKAGVSSGLQPGEKVVVEGQGTLTNGMRVSIAGDKPATEAAASESGK